MTGRDLRRHNRLIYSGSIRLSWNDAQGQPKYTLAKCIDISKSGLRVESAEPVPIRANVSLRADRINISGSASVRYVARRGSKFILGLELSHTLREDPPVPDSAPSQ